ncbi:MAG: glycosyltransferase [Bacteroidales bacterium]|nr:glycosyltransferase [Bacteroidales bacterium]
MKDFIKKYQKVPVEEYPNKVTAKPVVSVCVQTYQHADYIGQCLDSILMQKTDFPFEILVGEDASSDETREICKQYAKSYPDKIRLFLHQRENNIPIKNRPSGRFNFVYNLFKARGEFVALCEGDDYWTDDLKLQKQLNYIKSDKGLAMVYTGFVELTQTTGKQEKNIYKKFQRDSLQGYIFNRLIQGNWLATPTVMARKADLENYVDYEEITIREFPMADIPTWLELAYHKKVGFIPEITAAHRVLENSASQSGIVKNRANFIEEAHMTRKYFLQKYSLSKEVDKLLEIRINRKRIRYAFLTNESEILEKAKNSLNDLGYTLSFIEKMYYCASRVKFLHLTVRNLLKLFRVKV